MKTLMDRLERFFDRTHHRIQSMMASDALQRANQKSIATDIHLEQFDHEIARLDEAVERLKDHGALLE